MTARRRGWLAYAAAASSALAAVVTLNLATGVGSSRSTTLAESAALAQRPGQLVVSPHLEHRGWVRGALRSRCPDVLVTGSSTMGQLSEDLFAPASFLNLWMGGPTLEDFRALAGHLKERGCRPGTIVLGVDPWWTGNPALQDERWFAWADDYARAVDLPPHARALVLGRVGWARFTESLSFTTTRESVGLAAARLRGGAVDETRLVDGPLTSACSALSGPHDLRAHDGRYVECASSIPGAEERLHLARTYLDRDVHSMRHWETLAERRLDALAALLAEWAVDVPHIVLLAPPYHPEAWRTFQADRTVHELLERLEARLQAMEGPHVRFVNARDPASVGCTDATFIDSHHPAHECMATVASRVTALVQNWK